MLLFVLNVNVGAGARAGAVIQIYSFAEREPEPQKIQYSGLCNTVGTLLYEFAAKVQAWGPDVPCKEKPVVIS